MSYTNRARSGWLYWVDRFEVKESEIQESIENIGLNPDRINCPIGIVGITGKEPSVIAVSAVAEFLLWQAAEGVKK